MAQTPEAIRTGGQRPPSPSEGNHRASEQRPFGANAKTRGFIRPPGLMVLGLATLVVIAIGVVVRVRRCSFADRPSAAQGCAAAPVTIQRSTCSELT